MAFASIFFERNWPVAKYHSRRAIECDPNIATSHGPYAFYLTAAGRHEEAIGEITRSIELDPVSALVLENAAYHYYMARRFDEALDYCQRSLALDPNFAWSHLIVGMIDIQRGLFDKAISVLEKLTAFDLYSDGFLGYACGASGRYDRAQQILCKLEEKLERGEGSAYSSALTHLGMDEHKEALDCLEIACKEHPSFILMAWLKPDPIWDPIRSNRRFNDLVKGMNFPE